MCDVVEETKPDVVSFHFGLPEPALLQRLKAGRFLVMSSATTAAEARWLEARGVDAVIAQGYEAGGHRRGRHHRCTRHCGGLRARGRRRADGYGVSVVSGGEDLDCASRRAQIGAR